MNLHEQEQIVNATALQNVCSQLYQEVGVAQSDADTIAEMQVLMDLRGVHSHATRGLPGYVRGIISGNINPNPQLQTLEDNPASVLLDGDRGLGHLVSIRAMNLAIEKAGEGCLNWRGYCSETAITSELPQVTPCEPYHTI